MLKYKKLLVAILYCFGFFCIVKSVVADTINVANYGDGTCSLTNAQSAYDAALVGDTIVFPVSGSCTWSSALTVGKAVNIIGNGTTLTASGSMSNGFFNITGFTASSLVRISDFTFQMVNSTPAMAVYVHDMQGGVSGGNIRIDNNIFHFGNEAVVFDHMKGLVDHNYFYNSIQGVTISAGSRINADASWVSLAAGTSDAIFIEDNHFITDENYVLGYTQEQIGTHNGAKLVVRHNEFDSDNMPDGLRLDPFMAHGSADGGCGGAGYWEASSCQRRGQSVIEFYDNVEHGKRIDFLFITRGSANLVYNNSITGSVSNNPRIMLIEEEYTSDNWSIHRTAWPAEDQVHNTFIWNNTYRGYDFNDGVYGSVETDPTNYNCTANEIPMSCCTGSGTGTCGENSNPTSNPFLRKDRDYFLHAPCSATDTSDGYENICTHGKETFIGQNGASAGYPTDGSVYANLGNMIFTANEDNAYLGYISYIYPHPLQAESDSTPPVVTSFNIPSTSSSLTVSVSSFTATDNTAVIGYMLTESASAPAPGDSNWQGSTPANYTFSTEGTKNLYAWAKDANGNVSTGLSDSVTISLTSVNDTTPPVRSTGSPAGSLSSSTKERTISLSTDENSTCRYATAPDIDYNSMTNTFTNTGGTNHSTLVTGLSSNNTYHYYVQCIDNSNNANTDNWEIFFTIKKKSSSSSEKSSPKRTIKNTPKNITRGQVIVQSGKKFSKNSRVALYFSRLNGTYYSPKYIQTDKKGSFSTSYRVNKSPGKYKWYAVDLKTGKKSKTASYQVK